MLKRYVVEAVDTCNEWSSAVGHGSSGVALALLDVRNDYRNSMCAEDECTLFDWMNDMWKLIDKDQWVSDMSCSILIDGCTFAISDISDSKH